VHSCHFWSCGLSSIMQSEEPGKISDVQKNCEFTSVGPVYTQDNLILVLGTRLILR
jgi:hypothetical protein